MNSKNDLSSLMGTDFRHGLELLMDNAGAGLKRAREMMTLRPNMDDVVVATAAATVSLNTFVCTAASIEKLTCRPTPPHMITFVKESTEALQELAGEVIVCKLVIDAGNSRKRSPTVEN